MMHSKSYILKYHAHHQCWYGRIPLNLTPFLTPLSKYWFKVMRFVKMNQSLTGRNGAILSLTEIFWACWNRSCDVVLQSGVDHSQMIFGRVPTSAAESRQTCQQTGFILLCHQDTLPIMAGYDWTYCSWYSVRCAQIYPFQYRGIQMEISCRSWLHFTFSFERTLVSSW